MSVRSRPSKIEQGPSASPYDTTHSYRSQLCQCGGGGIRFVATAVIRARHVIHGNFSCRSTLNLSEGLATVVSLMKLLESNGAQILYRSAFP